MEEQKLRKKTQNARKAPLNWGLVGLLGRQIERIGDGSMAKKSA